MKTIIIYGSTLGNTENVARLISEKIENSEVMPVGAESISKIGDYDFIILGTSTWGVGELQDDWDSSFDALEKADFSGKKVALFGLGDQQGYCDTFLDGMGILYEKLRELGADIQGSWPVEGYDFSSSRAVVDGAFVGLALDEDCQSAETSGRIIRWIESLGL